MAHSSGGEIVVYDQAPLERVSSEELIVRQPSLLAPGTERLYIPTEVVIGNYGVAGALLIDSHPETRWWSYDFNVNRWGDSHCPESLEDAAQQAEEDGGQLLSKVYGDAWEEHATSFLRGTGEDDPERLAHFIATARGFKMIRAFLTPPDLTKQIEGVGKHIGPALIQECFAGEDAAGNIPAEEHMEQWPEYDWDTDTLLDEDEEPDKTKFGVLFDQKIGGLEAALNMGRSEREFYVSFHGWPWYQKMINSGQASLYRSIAQLDGLISGLDRKKTIDDRGLEELVHSHTPTIKPLNTGGDERT